MQIASYIRWAQSASLAYDGAMRPRRTRIAPGAPAVSPSPLADALLRVGDRWSLLIVDALTEGPMRFNDLSRAVAGIAPNILADRLRHLEEVDIVIAEPYSARPVRLEYRLTEEGRGLAGVLRSLAAWGGQGWDHSGAVHHRACGAAMEGRWYCSTCDRVVDDDEASELLNV